ncbi:MAG: aminotransferase class IV family protein [Bacteroidetes bacterium]|nr:aminotransferase class IV family protein [Bacteroidota bacterium]MBL7104025.1 aminotransferase class IV family protein [Bacteroidales bacterium]
MSDCIGDKFIINTTEQPVSELNDEWINTVASVYEVLRVEEGIPLFVEDHLNRLFNTFRLCKIDFDLNKKDVQNSILRLININHVKSSPVKLIFINDGKKQHFITCLMKAHKPTPTEYTTGVKTIILHEERKNPNAKVWNNSFRYKTENILRQHSAFEAILVNRNGYITEGSRSNIFLIKGKTIYTTPAGLVLPGITRQKVLNICNSIGNPVIEKMIYYKELKDFESLFITGTTREILPVRSVDKMVFTAENKLMQRISDEYELLVADYIKHHSDRKFSPES